MVASTATKNTSKSPKKKGLHTAPKMTVEVEVVVAPEVVGRTQYQTVRQSPRKRFRSVASTETVRSTLSILPLSTPSMACLPRMSLVRRSPVIAENKEATKSSQENKNKIMSKVALLKVASKSSSLTKHIKSKSTKQKKKKNKKTTTATMNTVDKPDLQANDIGIDEEDTAIIPKKTPKKPRRVRYVPFLRRRSAGVTVLHLSTQHTSASDMRLRAILPPLATLFLSSSSTIVRGNTPSLSLSSYCNGGGGTLGSTVAPSVTTTLEERDEKIRRNNEERWAWKWAVRLEDAVYEATCSGENLSDYVYQIDALASAIRIYSLGVVIRAAQFNAQTLAAFRWDLHCRSLDTFVSSSPSSSSDKTTSTSNGPVLAVVEQKTELDSSTTTTTTAAPTVVVAFDPEIATMEQCLRILDTHTAPEIAALLGVALEGKFVCGKCGGKKVSWIIIQTSRGDENFGLRFACHNKKSDTNEDCGHTWRG